MVIRCTESSWRPGVNTGSNLSILMIWVMGQRGLRKLDDTKAGGVADTRGSCCYPEGPPQAGEMGWREPWAVQWGKNKVLHSGRNKPMPQDVLGAAQMEAAQPAEKALGTLVDTRLDISGQGVLAAEKANAILGCVRRPGAGGKGTLPLCPAPWPVLGSPVWETWTYWKNSAKSHKGEEGTRASHPWGESETTGRRKGLEKKRLGTSHQHAINIWNVGAKQSQAFSSDSQCQDQRQWHKHRKFPMSIKKQFFTVRMIRHKAEVAQKCCGASFLGGILKSELFLGKVLWDCHV